MRSKIIFVIFLVWTQMIWAQDHVITLDLQNAALPDALRMIAKSIPLNVIISPTLNEKSVSVHFQDASAREALDIVLASQGLAKWQVGNMYFIATQLELIKHKEEELKLQEITHEAAPLITRVWPIHYAKAEDVAHLLQDNNYSLLSKRGHVRVDARTNVLCIQDVEKNLLEMQNVIKHVDVPVQQVLIEARLASVNVDVERELGINFDVLEQETAPQNTSTLIPSVMNSNHFSLAVARLANSSLLDAKLAALESEGRGELISSPSLFTANQQTASIESGEEIPYQEVSRSGGTGVAFKKAVLSLKVTPQIMPNGKILLQLQINQDKPSSRMVLGVPAINTRQIATSITVNDGQAIALGGIYERNKEYGEQRVPFLYKIPGIGELFQQHNTLENKRELIILIRPRLIK